MTPPTSPTPTHTQYKLIARAPLLRHELPHLHTFLTHLLGPITQSLHALQTHSLTSPTPSTTTILSTLHPSLPPSSSALLSAKQRVQSSHLILYQTWKNSGYVYDGLTPPSKSWPKPLLARGGGGAHIRFASLWTRVYNALTDDGMRVARNYFAHRFGVTAGSFAVEVEEAEELEMMRWVAGRYGDLGPAVESLIGKLEVAMGEEGVWMEGRPAVGDGLGEEGPGYARDTEEVEEWLAEREKQRAEGGEGGSEDEDGEEGEDGEVEDGDDGEDLEGEVVEGADAVANVDCDSQVIPQATSDTQATFQDALPHSQSVFSTALTRVLNTLFKLKIARRFAATAVEALQSQLLAMQGYQGREHWIERGRDVYRPGVDEDVEAQWGDFDDDEDPEQEGYVEPVVHTEWVDDAPW